MARKDEILNSFLKHELLTSKHEVRTAQLPTTVREALNSDIPIVKAIALVVEGLESPTQITDAALRNQITQFLNEAI
ncbi:MAG: hypothetical protein ACHQII_00425 [Bacteroidia bacterium]